MKAELTDGKKRISLSVTELVRFAAAGGDIDLRFGEGSTSSAGIAAHKKLRRGEGALYVSEVPLCCETERGGIVFSVTGRADGIIEMPEGEITVDEIKSTVRPPEMMSPGVHTMHFSQCAAYAFFYCRDKGLDGARVRLTYLDINTDRVYRATEYRRVGELEEEFMSLLDRFMPVALAVIGRELLRAELAGASFPYDGKRAGQRDMIIEAYRAIKAGERLFVSAPTGIGKTVSALYPALKAVGTNDADRVFYLCAKSVTASQAAETAERLGAGNLRTVILSAREKMCINEKKPSSGSAGEVCNPSACRCAAGHHGRCVAALRELLSEGGTYTSERIRRTAERYSVCPYELSLDLSELCTVIICDYNYVFSPRVMLRRYFDDTGEGRVCPGEQFVLLVDEAHNLISRAREMFSAGLSSSELSAMSVCGGNLGEAAEALSSAVISAAEDNISEWEEYSLPDGTETKRGACTVKIPPTNVTEAAESFCRAALARMMMSGDLPQEVTDAYYSVSAYYKTAKNSDERFPVYISKDGESAVCRLICADPSVMLSKILAKMKSSMFFSATLAPSEYYVNLLSGPGTAGVMELESPFPPENLSVTVVDKFSTRFGDREVSTSTLSDLIAGAVGAKKGNYIVYFPSYNYMNGVYEKFRRRYPKVETHIQENGAGEKKRAEFLAAFRGDGVRRVFFCVLGGLYSEGIDLVGDRLIGSVIVGVGIPQISDERNLLAEYYEREFEAGFDYAYTYPGMNRVLQAAGRVIRSETDRGIVVLIDDRYADGKYRELFPTHWQNIKYVGDAASLREVVRRFWSCESE